MTLKKIGLKFGEWLIEQQFREDSIGDLARVPGMQKLNPKISTRKSDEHKKWVETIVRIDQPGYISIFNEAWQEFLLARQAAIDDLD